jgi:SurA N-terminal domain
MRRILVVLCLLALAAPVAHAQEPVPPGLSREAPISVFGKTIAIGEIEHLARISARMSGGRTRQHFDQAAIYLISREWLEGEARAQGIRVSARQVRREFRSTRDQSFPSLHEYRRFLRDTGQSNADIRVRVRLDLITRRLRDRIVAGVDDEQERQRRLDSFVADFSARWRSVTLCTPRFADLPGQCANGADAG